MATIKPTITTLGRGDGSCVMLLWTPVTEADVCAAAEFPDLSDKSIHVYGTFGGSSTAIHGSNNGGSSFAALNDPSSTVIAITTEKIKQILENTQQIKPVITGGTGQTLSVAVLVKQNNPLRT